MLAVLVNILGVFITGTSTRVHGYVIQHPVWSC